MKYLILKPNFTGINTMIKAWVSYKSLPSGKWRIRFRAKKRPEVGVTLPSSLQEKTIKNKVIWYQEQIKQGYFNPWQKEDNRKKVTEAIQEYINISKPKWSESSYLTEVSRANKLQRHIPGNTYIRNVKDWNWFNDLPLKKDKHDTNGYSAASVSSYYVSTRTFLNFCIEQKYIEDYKLTLDSEVVKRLNQSSVKYITHGELTAVCEAFIAYREQTGYERVSRYRHTRLWWVMFWQCLRKNEPLYIKKEFVNFDSMKIKVFGKGGTMHWIPIIPPAKKHFQWFIDNPRKGVDNLFGFKSMASTMNEFRAFVRKKLPHKQNGGFHQLRHGGAVHYLTEGVPIIFVSKLLRHKSTKVTSEVYADIIEGMEGSAFTNIKDEPIE